MQVYNLSTPHGNVTPHFHICDTVRRNTQPRLIYLYFPICEKLRKKTVDDVGEACLFTEGRKILSWRARRRIYE
jgi:hypothetical protein